MRFLLIADLFPPDPGGRSEKMLRHIKYLNQNDIKTDVLCPATIYAPKSYHLHDFMGRFMGRCYRVKPFLCKEMPSLKWQDGFGVRSFLGRSYLRVGLPGGYLRWLIPVFRFSHDLIQRKGYNAVVCVSNPMAIQLLGILLVKRVRWLRLVSELRDPLVGYYRSRHFNTTNMFMERLMAKYADRIIEWEDFSPNSFAERHPEVSQKCVRIANVGFDPEEYYNYNPEISYGDELKIVYTGGYYGEKNLWRLFLTTVSEMVEQGARIRVEYFGDWVAEQEEIRMGLLSDSSKWLVNHGRVPKEVCIQAAQSGHALLYLLDPNEENLGRISSKLYDYFASRRPILALVPQQSVAENKILMFSPHFVLSMPMNWNKNYALYRRELRRILEKLFVAQYNRALYTYIETDVARYSCEHGEKKFADVISGILRRNNSTSAE